MERCVKCGNEMSTSDGCDVETVVIDGQVFDRIRVGDPGDASEGGGAANRCRDCNALHGHHHHWGCESECCPACGRLLTGCRCGEVRTLSDHNEAARAICYGRVAAPDQYALDWQARQGRRYARLQGYRMVAMITESGSDSGMNRPGLRHLMEHIENHDFDVLILGDLTRLGRNLACVLPLLKSLRDNGIRVESPVKGSLDGLLLCRLTASLPTPVSGGKASNEMV